MHRWLNKSILGQNIYRNGCYIKHWTCILRVLYTLGWGKDPGVPIGVEPSQLVCLSGETSPFPIKKFHEAFMKTFLYTDCCYEVFQTLPWQNQCVKGESNPQLNLGRVPCYHYTINASDHREIYRSTFEFLWWLRNDYEMLIPFFCLSVLLPVRPKIKDIPGNNLKSNRAKSDSMRKHAGQLERKCSRCCIAQLTQIRPI